jgi:DNA-binding transcriptional regulator YiaG
MKNQIIPRKITGGKASWSRNFCNQLIEETGKSLTSAGLAHTIIERDLTTEFLHRTRRIKNSYIRAVRSYIRVLQKNPTTQYFRPHH